MNRTSKLLSSSFSHRALPVVLRAHHLLAAHGADALLVGALLAEVRSGLVHLGLADPALLELCSGRQGVEAVLLGRQEFVLAHFAAAALCSVGSAALPRVGSDDLQWEWNNPKGGLSW